MTLDDQKVQMAIDCFAALVKEVRAAQKRDISEESLIAAKKLEGRLDRFVTLLGEPQYNEVVRQFIDATGEFAKATDEFLASVLRDVGVD